MSSPMSSSHYRTRMMNSMKNAIVYTQLLLLLELLDVLKSWVHEYVRVVYQVEVQRRILYILCTVFPS